jgi:GTP cyclohydrolase II
MPFTKPEIEGIINRDKRHCCEGAHSDVCVKIVAIADFPTRYGKFQIIAFYNNRDDKEHVAVMCGSVADQEAVPVRMHSECLTGDALGSLRCDCGDQLRTTLRMISQQGIGLVLYLRQEGRGIGLLNKLKAYQLQDTGMDTVEANVALGFKPDERDYAIAAHMLRSLHVRSIRLITNNPAKIKGLVSQGIKVVDRIPLVIRPNEHNRAYLETKMVKAGHLLQDILGRDDEVV